MAAYASPSYNVSSPTNGLPAGRGNWSDPRNGRPNSSSGKVFPHIKDIIRDANPSTPPDASLTQLLTEVENCISTSRSSLDFGRPDFAYKNFLIAYTIAIERIPRHREYGFFTDNHRHWAVKYKTLRQRLNEMDTLMNGARRTIEENNQTHGTQPNSMSGGVNYTQNGVQQGDESNSERSGLSKVPSHEIPDALRIERARPISKPKPEGLQSRPISGGVTDLNQRFAQLRRPSQTSAATTILSMPKAVDYQNGNNPRPQSYSTQIPASPNAVLPGRPAGPRRMPSNGPSIPPKIPISTAMAMPKPPSPTYSPINLSTAGLSQASNRASNEGGRPSNEKIQAYYGHSSNQSLHLQRTREEISNPYRPTTPNGVHSAIISKSSSSEIPHQSMIDAVTLRSYMTRYNVLLVDIRERSVFDEGHIMASSIICIEPISLSEGMSAEELEDRLVLAPDAEQVLFSRRNEFDIVVYYDQETSNDSYLRGHPAMTSAPALRAFYDTLYEFNDTKQLKDGRPPALLNGGVEAWIDYMGVHSLAQSRTAAMLGTTRQQPASRGNRSIARQRMVSSNSRFEIRNRRLRGHTFLDEKEQQAWRQQAQQEEVTPTEQSDISSDGDYVIVDEPPSHSPFVTDVDTFLRRFPSVQHQQSMVMAPPRRPAPPVPRHAVEQIPSIPTRPAPAIPRPSYSGQAEINQSQAPLARVTSSTRPPLYSSASLTRNRRLPRTGLTNFGVTCYMNSTLQCLSATVQLSNFFNDRLYKQYVQQNWKGSNGIMPDLYANVVNAVWKDDCNAIKPSTFRNFCGRMNREWVIDRQQDAKEFFDFLVDCLHEDLNVNWQRTQLRPLTTAEEMQRERIPIIKASPIEWQRYEHRDNSFVSSLFAGQHASRLRCMTCHKTSTTYEAFYSISIEIPRSGIGNIYDCLKSYTKEERLSASERWKCPYCKCDRDATKQIILTRLPQQLVIHFKRFAASKTERAKKIHTPIDFPLAGFNLDDFVIPRPQQSIDQDGKIDVSTTPPYTYDAYGVLRHIGNSGDGGHYISIVKDFGRACWRKFDDERHYDLDPNKLGPRDCLQNAEAYIVFYQRTVAK